MHFKVPHFRQNIGHKARVGVAITLFTGAFLLTSGIITRAYSQEKKPKGGDTVLLMQTSGFKTQEAKKETIKTPEYIPAPLKPYLKTLEYYVPPPLTLKDFADRSPDVESFRLFWRRADTNYPSFGLPKTALDSCKAEDQQMVGEKWKLANVKLIVAFTMQNGLTPEDALNPAKGGYDPNSREVQDMKRQWRGGKEIDRLKDELIQQRPTPVKKE